jgi:Ca2+-binding RTX toxin-like protein
VVPAANALPANTYNVVAKVTDAAGNSVTDVSTNELVINATVPTVNALTTNDTTPTITGFVTVGVNENFTVTVNGTKYYMGDGKLSVSGGTWSLTIPPANALVDGTYAVTASVINNLQQVRTDATTNELKVDTVAPAIVPTITASTAMTDTPTITGTATVGAGETLTVTVGGVTYTEGDGNLSRLGSGWTLNVPPANALTDGTYEVIAKVTDAAGNFVADASTNELYVNAVADAPVVVLTPNGITEGQVAIGTVVASFVTTDQDGDIPTHQLLNDPNGYFTLSGNNVVLTAAGVAAINNDTLNLTSLDITVQANDGTGNLTAVTSTATVIRVDEGVNNAPVGIDSAVSATEDTPYVFSSADFGYSDPNDTPANALHNVIITTLPDNGTLTLDGVAVTAGTTVSAVEIDAGLLVYTPEADTGGAALTNFTFQVQDDGGVLLGGQNTDQSPNTMTVNVTGVADTPILTVHSQQLSLSQPPVTIGTATAITQATIETQLGLPAGSLDTQFNPAGNDPGFINVTNGEATTYSILMEPGSQANFDWSFTTAEDVQWEIDAGYNDVAFVVIDDGISPPVVQMIMAAEIAGPSATRTGTYTFVAPADGVYSLSWVIMNGGDTIKQSDFAVNNVVVTDADGNDLFGAAFRLQLGAVLTDTDSSETLTLQVSGVPAGGSLSAGVDAGGGVWNLTAADLQGLVLIPPLNYLGTINLTVAATSTDFGGNAATVSEVITIDVAQTINSVLGTAGADTLTGTAANDLIQGGLGNDNITGADGLDILSGGAGDDILDGGLGHDQLFGDTGNDSLDGGAGNDTLKAGAGNDTVIGGVGLDLLEGGSGNDILTGGADTDVFTWKWGDQGTEAAPASDTITDFVVGTGGDILNFADLLQGEENTASLDSYLNFTFNGGDTQIHIDVDAGTTFAPTQTVILSGVDLSGYGTSGQEIIDALLNMGNLIVD